MTVFPHPQTTNKRMNVAANDSARVSGQDRKIPPGLAGKIVKYRPLSEPIRLQDLQDSSRSQAWKKKNYWMRFFLISEIISSNPQPSAPLITLTVACVASVSARVRRESWDESKKKKEWRGKGRGKKETLTRKPHDFEKLRSPTNAAFD